MNSSKFTILPASIVCCMSPDSASTDVALGSLMAVIWASGPARASASLLVFVSSNSDQPMLANALISIIIVSIIGVIFLIPISSSKVGYPS